MCECLHWCEQIVFAWKSRNKCAIFIDIHIEAILMLSIFGKYDLHWKFIFPTNTYKWFYLFFLDLSFMDILFIYKLYIYFTSVCMVSFYFYLRRVTDIYNTVNSIIIRQYEIIFVHFFFMHLYFLYLYHVNLFIDLA